MTCFVVELKTSCGRSVRAAGIPYPQGTSNITLAKKITPAIEEQAKTTKRASQKIKNSEDLHLTATYTDNTTPFSGQ